jgi:hypothetical protein
MFQGPDFSQTELSSILAPTTFERRNTQIPLARLALRLNPRPRLSQCGAFPSLMVGTLKHPPSHWSTRGKRDKSTLPSRAQDVDRLPSGRPPRLAGLPAGAGRATVAGDGARARPTFASSRLACWLTETPGAASIEGVDRLTAKAIAREVRALALLHHAHAW